MSSSKKSLSARSKTSASKKKLEALEKTLRSEFRATLDEETLSLRKEIARLKREHKREIGKKKKTDAMNVGLFDQENTDQKLIAMENLHREKSRSLQKSIEKYRLEIKKLQAQNTDNNRSRQIQGLKSQLKDSELKADVLKRMLAERWGPAGGWALDVEENITNVNTEIIKQTIGGPKRFRPKTREELVEELKKFKKEKLKEKDKYEKKVDYWKRKYNAEVAEQAKNNPGGAFESKVSDTDRTDAPDSARKNHEARIMEFMDQVSHLKGEINVLNKTLLHRRADNEELNRKLSDLKPVKAERDNLKQSLSDNEDEMGILNDQLSSANKNVIRLTEECNRYREELKATKETGAKRSEDDMRQQNQYQLKLSEYNNKIKSLEKEIATLQDEKKLQISTNKDLTLGAQQKLEEEKKRSMELEESTRQMQRKSDETSEKINKLHSQLAALTAEKLEVEKHNVELEKDCENLRGQAQSEVEKSGFYKSQLEKIQEAHAEERKNQHDTSQNSLSVLSQDKEKFERQIKELTQEVADKEEQLKKTVQAKSELEATLKKQTVDHDSRNQGGKEQIEDLQGKISELMEQVEELTAERDSLKKKTKAQKKEMKEIAQLAKKQQMLHKKKIAELEGKLSAWTALYDEVYVYEVILIIFNILSFLQHTQPHGSLLVSWGRQWAPSMCRLQSPKYIFCTKPGNLFFLLGPLLPCTRRFSAYASTS